jgi:hypothetical protein
MRKHLKHVFDPVDDKGNAIGNRPGKHHWTTQRWFQETQNFLSDDLNLGSCSSDRNVWALVLLLYPAFGPSHKFDAHDSIKDNLG